MRPHAAKQTVKDTVPRGRCLLWADFKFSFSMLIGKAICRLYPQKQVMIEAYVL